MAKFRSWFHTQMLGNCLIPDTPKRNDHTKLAQVFELASKERTTVGPFVGCGFIRWRCAFNR